MPRAQCGAIEIEYESFGDARNPAVILIMGVGAQLIQWPLPLCKGLVDLGFRVIRFDNRDIGKSTVLTELGVPDVLRIKEKADAGLAPDAPYRLDDMAMDTMRLMDALDIEDAHLIGASMGGMIAQIVAATAPERARSLVSMMSTTGRRDLPQAKPEALAALLAPPRSAARDDLIAAGMAKRRAIESPAHPLSDEDLFAEVAAAIDRVPYEPGGAARQMAAIFAAEPRNSLLKEVRCPTLVLHGAEDPLVSVEAGRDTAESVRGARFVTVPGWGHDLAPSVIPILMPHIGEFLRFGRSHVEGRLTPDQEIM